MQKRNGFWRSAPFALAALVSLASFLPAQRSQEHGEADGRLRGLWSLPGPEQPGGLVGVLFLEGEPAYRIRAHVGRNGPLGPDGGIVGVAFRAGDTEGSEPLALRGIWEGDLGRGGFRAVILEPGGSEEAAPRLVQMRGRFRDPLGPDPGHFRGSWSSAD